MGFWEEVFNGKKELDWDENDEIQKLVKEAMEINEKYAAKDANGNHTLSPEYWERNKTREDKIRDAIDEHGYEYAYKKYGYDPNGYYKKRDEEVNYNYDPGIHTRSYRGSADEVVDYSNRFHEYMAKKYDNYRVISTNTVQTACDTVTYITFEVGKNRYVTRQQTKK